MQIFIVFFLYTYFYVLGFIGDKQTRRRRTWAPTASRTNSHDGESSKKSINQPALMTHHQIDGINDCFISGYGCSNDDKQKDKSGYANLWKSTETKSQCTTITSRIEAREGTGAKIDGAATTSGLDKYPFTTNTSSSIDIVFADEEKRRVLTKNQLKGRNKC